MPAQLKALQSRKRETHKAVWYYLHIMAYFGPRLYDNIELNKYVYARYLRAKKNDQLAWRKIRNYIKGI